jgi:putative intracellular protease/amidase
MVSGGADVLLPLTRGHDEVRIALYDAAGVGGSGPKRLERAFRDQPGSWLERVGPAEIQAGALRQFDVLICPGGSAHVQARALTPAGCREIRDFVAAGRGYVGFCAGAYLAASNYTWSLGILDANVVDRAHWQRGKGLVQIELTPEGQRLLGATATTFEVRYANGPLLEPGGRPDVPDFAPLAYYRGEVAKNGAPKGVMPNTPAMVAGTWGRGRVFVSSPHPESTPGLDDDLVRHAVRWAAGR